MLMNKKIVQEGLTFDDVLLISISFFVGFICKC